MGSEPFFGVVEIMGHRVRAGELSEATIGGAVLLRVTHPELHNDQGELLTEFYAPQSIFCIRPCSEAEARAAAAYSWPTHSPRPALAAPFDDLLDEDDDALEDFDEVDA